MAAASRLRQFRAPVPEGVSGIQGAGGDAWVVRVWGFGLRGLGVIRV